MKWSILLSGLMLIQVTQQIAGVNVKKISAPQKALQFDVVVSANTTDVWSAFTTNSGLKTWLWSDVEVDLKPGGNWLVNYPGGKTGGGTIVSFETRKRITIRAMAPEQFPTVRRQRTTAVFEFEPVDAGHTRVKLTQTGWKEGKEWDDAYEYLATGNAQLLAQLKLRFDKGPIDWTKLPG